MIVRIANRCLGQINCVQILTTMFWRTFTYFEKTHLFYFSSNFLIFKVINLKFRGILFSCIYISIPRRFWVWWKNDKTMWILESYLFYHPVLRELFSWWLLFSYNIGCLRIYYKQMSMVLSVLNQNNIKHIKMKGFKILLIKVNETLAGIFLLWQVDSEIYLPDWQVKFLGFRQPCLLLVKSFELS